jgi:hypothetical protein
MHKKPRSVVHLSPALKSLQATTITSKNIFKTLNSVRSAWSGVHKASYKLMGYAWQIVLLLRKNKELKAEFVSLAKLKVKKAKKRNIADAVMMKASRVTKLRLRLRHEAASKKFASRLLNKRRAASRKMPRKTLEEIRSRPLPKNSKKVVKAVRLTNLTTAPRRLRCEAMINAQ